MNLRILLIQVVLLVNVNAFAQNALSLTKNERMKFIEIGDRIIVKTYDKRKVKGRLSAIMEDRIIMSSKIPGLKEYKANSDTIFIQGVKKIKLKYHGDLSNTTGAVGLILCGITTPALGFWFGTTISPQDTGTVLAIPLMTAWTFLFIKSTQVIKQGWNHNLNRWELNVLSEEKSSD